MPTDEPQAEELADSDQVEGIDEGELTVEDSPGGIQLEKADRSLFELHHWYKKGSIVIDPEWQRKYVWDKKRASKLVESFLISLPVPVVYFAINADTKYEVIDGLQRLTSIFRFFNNEIALVGLEILKNLNGKTFDQLDKQMQDRLEMSVLRTFEISQTTSKDLMFIIFERLNTGGVTLNDMEIRNCLYRGKLNELIKSLSGYSEFVQAIAQKGIDKRMLDRALVLRFLAFYQLTYKNAKKGLKSFFNEFFQTYRNPAESKLKEYRKSFELAMRASFTIFGDKAFRLRRNSEKGGGEWAPRANAAVLQVIAVSFTAYDIGHLTRCADSIYESYIDLITVDDKWVDSVSVSTGDYSKLEYAVTTWEERLKSALISAKPNDKKRLFTRSLKEQMYEENSTCKICEQKIASIVDAALDHNEMYWKGGLTVPSNARLVHRLCNWERKKKTEEPS
jgi:Protein of unknown function DUF262